MTTLSDIITQGYREINLIALGKSPSTAQAAEGLTLLNNVLEVCLGSDAGEELTDWPLGNYGRQTADRFSFTVAEYGNPPINTRLLALEEQALTVYLPPSPSDGARMGMVDMFSRLAALPVTLDGNGRMIEDAASILLDTDGLNRRWLFRADLGKWVRLTDLTAEDEMPFPVEFDFYFWCLLALRMGGRSGRKLSAETQAAFKPMRKRFVARYVQHENLKVNTDLDRAYMSKQSYDYNRGFGEVRDFDRGF